MYFGDEHMSEECFMLLPLVILLTMTV